MYVKNDLLLSLAAIFLIDQNNLNIVGIGPIRNIFDRKTVNIFLPINLNISFGCSKGPSH